MVREANDPCLISGDRGSDRGQNGHLVQKSTRLRSRANGLDLVDIAPEGRFRPWDFGDGGQFELCARSVFDSARLGL